MLRREDAASARVRGSVNARSADADSAHAGWTVPMHAGRVRLADGRLRLPSREPDHTCSNLGPRAGSDSASPNDAGARLRRSVERGRAVVIHDRLDVGIRTLAKDADAAGIACRRHVHVARIAADADHSGAEQKLIGVLIGNQSALTKNADTGKHIVRSGLQTRDTADTVYAGAACTSAKQAFAATPKAEHSSAFPRPTETRYTGGIATCVGEKPPAPFAAFGENAGAPDIAA